jgi:phosphoglycerol transferase MdoB-like AlkP superfamily enzyme
VVSQIDVMPTIASLCGVSHVNTTLGRDILRLDSSRSFAFTFDPDNAKIGLVKGDHYYRQFLQNGREEIVSIRKGGPEPTQTQLAEYRRLTTSFYHTSGYLLTHNPNVFKK